MGQLPEHYSASSTALQPRRLPRPASPEGRGFQCYHSFKRSLPQAKSMETFSGLNRPIEERAGSRNQAGSWRVSLIENMRLLTDIFGQTLRTLWAHKLSSFLTMFGIAWGVGSLLLLIGLVEGFRSGNRKQLETIGEDIMFMFGGRIPAVEGSFASMKEFTLTYDDYLAVKQEAKHIRSISPVLNRGDIRAVSDYNSTNGQVFGVTSNYPDIRYMPQGIGRWLNDKDDEERRQGAGLAAGRCAA